VKYRPPFGTRWQEISLDEAMDRIADRLWESRERTFDEERDGRTLMQCAGVAHLGGATLDNEENYLLKKFLTGGLGITRVSNQARI
jgi:formate dehydrogenase major subunit